jgi:lysophospholipase L1-like esterase
VIKYIFLIVFSTLSLVGLCQKTYLALGDSYTIAESVGKEGGFPNQVAKVLSKNGKIIIDTKIIARTGWTTKNLLNAIDTTPNIKEKYDFVTLLIGVNNQYQGKPVDQYHTEFVKLLEYAITKASGKPKNVVVVSIPDYGVTPFAKSKEPAKIKKEIDEYNSINKAYAQKYKVNYVDITDISREAAIDNSLLAEDKLHPSAKMYQLWAGRIVKTKKKI